MKEIEDLRELNDKKSETIHALEGDLLEDRRIAQLIQDQFDKDLTKAAQLKCVMEDQVEQGLHRESEQLAQLDHLKKEVHERDSEIE